MNLLIVLIPLIAVAMIIGGRKRRVGTEPHCRKCNYLLRGLSSERCPECGSLLSPDGIALGQPRRRVKRFIFGWLLLLLWGAAITMIATSQFQAIDWYSYEPTYFVLRDLNSSNNASALRAWSELTRRDTAGSLSPDTRDKLVRFALTQQANAAPPFSALDTAAINYLATRLTTGDLPVDQQKKIWDQSTVVTFTTRPKVIAGDSVPYMLGHVGCAPNNLWIRLTIESCAVDGKTLTGQGGSSETCGIGGVSSTGSSISPQPVGQHELSLTCHMDFFVSPPGAQVNPSIPPAHTVDRTFTAKFEVLPKNAAASLQKINDPKLAAAMKAAISLASFHYDTANHWIEGTVQFNNVPANAAFDVVARYNGSEHSLGSATANANSGQCYYGVTSTTAPQPPANIDILLRPSEKAASGTVNMLDYWNQEFDFPNVPLPRH